jgi:hypothetical protein
MSIFDRGLHDNIVLLLKTGLCGAGLYVVVLDKEDTHILTPLFVPGD